VGRILAWVAGALGLAGLAKALSGRTAPTLPQAGPDPRAEELRRRLEEAKPLAQQPVEEADAPELPVDAVPDPEPARPRTREDVHAKAQAAIREMKSSGADEGGDAVGQPPGDA
jgi:hypothetical protein